MARYQIRKQALTAVRETVRENLRTGNAREIETWTRVIRWSLLLAGVFALIRFRIGALGALSVGCWGLFRMRELDGRFLKAALIGATGVFTVALMCFDPRDTGYLIYRGLVTAVLVLMMVRYACDAYGRVLAGIDDGLAGKWKKQWRLLRNTLLVTAIVFLLSIPLGLADLWAISILAGGAMGLFLVFRGWWLLSRTIGSCRRVIREKMMLDSLGQ